MRETWSFIETLALGAGHEPDAVRKWRQRGVPYRHRLALVKLAALEGKSLEESDFESPAQSRAAA